jgi:hypothetical protein
MGIDIYVGTFTRYHCADWENVAARYAREQNIPFEIIRTNPEPGDAICDPVIVGKAVEVWRASLAESLRESLPGGLAWDESPEADYFTDRPGWDGSAGLLLLAAHIEHPEFPIPERLARTWASDPALKAWMRKGAVRRFFQVCDVEMWLPVEFHFTFSAPDVAGHERIFGSSVVLLNQLRQLNDESYQADREELTRWMNEAAGSEDTFDKTAKFGLATFIHFSELSVEHRLPMILDY